MVKKFTDAAAFENLSAEAKEVIETSRYLEQHKITPGVKTEVIWLENEARTLSDEELESLKPRTPLV